jgi:hypothetical protein
VEGGATLGRLTTIRACFFLVTFPERLTMAGPP